MGAGKCRWRIESKKTGTEYRSGAAVYQPLLYLVFPDTPRIMQRVKFFLIRSIRHA